MTLRHLIAFGLSGLLISRAPATAQALLGDEVEVVVTYENRKLLPLPYVEIEIRQDQITEPAGQVAWAERLARLLPAAYAQFLRQ